MRHRLIIFFALFCVLGLALGTVLYSQRAARADTISTLLSGSAYGLAIEASGPAAGLSADEITRLGALIGAIARAGTGVLLVEHHADLIFDICHHVTVLNLGKVLAAGTPAEIRSHREVVNAYLGG